MKNNIAGTDYDLLGCDAMQSCGYHCSGGTYHIHLQGYTLKTIGHHNPESCNLHYACENSSVFKYVDVQCWFIVSLP